MSEEFFDKLKKGMNIENIPQSDFETKDIEEKTNAELTAFSEEIIPEEPEKTKRKKTVRKKTAKKKTAKTTAKKEKKIEIKQESEIEDETEEDIFQKEGQLTVDVFETDKDIIIQSAVAGVSPEDLDISIEKDMVSIRGKRERNVEEQTENFFYQECFWGRFSREVVLPSEVDKNKAEASIKNGVLTIKIPKINTSNNKKLNISIEE